MVTFLYLVKQLEYRQYYSCVYYILTIMKIKIVGGMTFDINPIAMARYTNMRK